ncbi:MAG TPA: Ig-like domain-containing protein, partial [Gemmataceae bacterium]|nr:Ig-like domain-containing protein [Gemmataceae bacterium]
FSQTFTVGAVNDAPTLDAIPDPAPIPEDDAGQMIALTGISAGGEDQALTVTATSSDPALVPHPAVEYASPGAGGALRVRPAADRWGSVVITVTVRDDGGTAFGGVDEVTRTFTINVEPRPDAPVIDTGLVPMVAAVPRKPAPTDPPGSPVADLVRTVFDADGDPLGLAVTATDTLKGTWQYSLNGGTNWQAVPTDVSATSALVLTADPATRVRFLPAKRFQGFSSFHFKAWDRSDLAGPGTRADTTLAPTAYSAVERAWVAVGKTKPVVTDTGATVLSPVAEDRKASRAFPVRTLLGIAALEQGVPAKNLGIAVTDLGVGPGTWQYRLARSKTWSDVGDVGLTSALLLGPKDAVRFVPAADASGRADLRFKTWNLTGVAGTKVDTAKPDFGTDFGFAAVTVTPVNDRPVMDLSVAAVLNPVFHTETTNARTFASMMSAADVEGAALGVAVIGTSSRGWEYRPVGGVFTPLSAVSAGNALLLDPATEVRFVAPIDALPGTATLSFKAWDQAPGSGAVGGRAPARGTAFSAQTEVVTVAISNSPPVLDTTPDVTLPPVALTGGLPPAGVSVKALLGAAVSDWPAPTLAIAVVFADTTNGRWQYTLNGRDYFDVGPVSEGSALLLADANRLRFVPSGPTAGTATIQYKAWDRSTGQIGDRIDTGPPLNSFSLDTETATVSFS